LIADTPIVVDQNSNLILFDSTPFIYLFFNSKHLAYQHFNVKAVAVFLAIRASNRGSVVEPDIPWICV